MRHTESPFGPVATCLAFALALALGACAGGNLGGTLSETAPRPKVIVVSDFVFTTDVTAVDRGFTSRLERKIGGFPTHERKRRTNERVNDEIIASIVATIRDAGLQAQPGNEDSLTLSDDAILITGTLRASDANAGKSQKEKEMQIGFGSGRNGVAADMVVSHFSSWGKKQLIAFTTEASAANAKTTAAHNAAIAAALSASGAASEKLSPDVEAQARRLGRAIGEKIVAFAKEQGWLEKAVAEGQPGGEGTVKLPEPKPTKKPAPKQAKKPAKPAAEKPDAQEKPAAEKPEKPASQEKPAADKPDKPDSVNAVPWPDPPPAPSQEKN